MITRRWYRPQSKEANCREVGQVLQNYLDGNVEAGFAEKIEAHLEKCRDCGLERDTYQQIKSSLARQSPSVDSEAIDRLREFGSKLTTE